MDLLCARDVLDWPLHAAILLYHRSLISPHLLNGVRAPQVHGREPDGYLALRLAL